MNLAEIYVEHQLLEKDSYYSVEGYYQEDNEPYISISFLTISEIICSLKVIHLHVHT
jgi:hypothetical protein